MSNLKVVVQLYDEKTGEYIGDADVRTTADLVFFADGQTFQQKLDNGTLRGQQGQKGDQGERGDQKENQARTEVISVLEQAMIQQRNARCF